MCITHLARSVCSLAVVFVLVAPSAGRADAAETSGEKAERMKWWVDARFGMFIHWGPVSLRGTEIGWSRGRQVPIDVYDNLYKEFNPVKFDAKEYVSLAREAGMKYITLVAKHHDGFAMYASRLSDYNIMNTPFHRDVAQELCDECRKQGIRFCTYYSIIDWHHPDYLPRGAGDKRPPKDANFDDYFAFMQGQLREIMENYHPAVMWFDGEWEDHWTVERGREIYAMLRELDPAIIVNNRLSKGRRWGVFHTSGMAPPETTVGDFGTPEQEPGRFSGIRNLYWESNMTLCRQWAWKPADKLKTLDECIDLLVSNAGYDGNFMINVGPMPSGEIEPRQAERLREIGRWMKQYGETIYGTRGGPFRPAWWGVSTCKAERIFIHILHFPFDGRVSLPALPRKIVASRLLSGAVAEVKQTDQRVTIAIPLAARQELDTVVELTLDGSAVAIRPLAE